MNAAADLSPQSRLPLTRDLRLSDRLTRGMLSENNRTSQCRRRVERLRLVSIITLREDSSSRKTLRRSTTFSV